MTMITLQTLVSGGRNSARGVSPIEVTTLLAMEEEIAALAIDAPYIFGLDVSQLEFVYMLCDGAITIRTNDAGTPQEVITLAANVPRIWMTGMPAAHIPFSGDITGFYITEDQNVARTLIALFGSNL